MSFDEFKQKAQKKMPEETGLVTWLLQYRRISYYIAFFLSKTPIKPNQISFLQPLFFQISAILIATGSYPLMLAGAIMGPFTILLDYVDGSLARGTERTSKLGKALDSAGFYQTQILVPLSITSAAFLQTRNDYVLLIGAITIFNIFMLFVGLKGSSLPKDVVQDTTGISTMAKPKPGVDIGWTTLTDVDTLFLIFWLGCLFNRPFYSLCYFLVFSFYEIFKLAVVYLKLLGSED